MSDRKVERLINLTLALLASKRYLTKSEIFENVAGYEGSLATVERMFERDKDELRSLGIEIEVGTLDSYFEDELGYRISPQSYGIDIGPLTPTEISYLSLASGLWRDQIFGTSAIRALSKLSVDPKTAPLDPSDLGLSLITSNPSATHIETLMDAIESRTPVSFTYDSDTHRDRSVEPYQLTLLRGAWYLVAREIEIGELRTFKLERITGEVSLNPDIHTFELPEDLTALVARQMSFIQQESELTQVLIKVKKGAGAVFRAKGIVRECDHEWDFVEFTTRDLRETASEIIWQTESVIAQKPQELITQIHKILSQKIGGVKVHD